MQIEGSVALVTGANRGLGAAFTRALVEGGAKVYGAARSDYTPDVAGVVPVRLDVTDVAAVAALAKELDDVTLVVNNAGIVAPVDLTGSDAPDVLDAVRANLETNAIAPLSVARAFAPVLAANGGGALVNVLSVLSWVTLPGAGAGYSASKAAAWQLTNALRLALRPQGTQVLAVHVGYMDTDMASWVEGPKLAPAEAAAQVLAALAGGREEVLLDDISRQVKAGLAQDISALYPA